MFFFFLVEMDDLFSSLNSHGFVNTNNSIPSVPVPLVHAYNMRETFILNKYPVSEQLSNLMRVMTSNSQVLNDGYIIGSYLSMEAVWTLIQMGYVVTDHVSHAGTEKERNDYKISFIVERPSVAYIVKKYSEKEPCNKT